MRILHILDHSIPLHSGYTFRSRAIIQQQHALGWETDHITGPKHNQAIEPDGLEETIDGLHFFRTRPSTGMLSKLPVLNQLAVSMALEKRLLEIVEKVKPDVLHAHSPALNGLAAVNVGRKLGIPVVYEVRAFWEDAAVDHGTSKEWGLRYRLTRMLETSVLKKAAGVTTICEGLRSDIVARGVSSEKVTVIPNAVDIAAFTAGQSIDEALVQKLGLQNKQVIGFIGSFYAYEGLLLLLQSMSEMLKAKPEVRLLLVGGGPEDEKLKTFVADNNLSDKVIFTGRVPHEKVQTYYDLIDVFVYPRLPMRLTELVTPLKPLEAMAQRRLVVASDVGGHKELIKDGVTGQLFPAGDAQALSATVIKLLDSEPQWEAQKDAGRQYVETERNWPVSIARYQKVYDNVMRKAV
ncbi:MAG: glycosyltransferase, exosortase A system-associated [Ectothiorhodospiraceae bacterium]|nr:glycosyltransferase, exosortase A system-associated [Ectothiorhodospiraceae bacterium]